MNVMLLAAGEGTRLRPYTLTLPKPAIPFLNVPLAGHSLGFLHGLSVDKLVVNTYHLPQKIHELFSSLPHGARSLHFSDEVGEILGSGGGLGKARGYFKGGDDFVFMNADEIILPKDDQVLSKAISQHKKNGNIATIMVMDHPGVGTQFGGVWADASNNVLGFGKTPIAGAVKAWHFIGVQILSEKVFDFIPLEGPSNILYDSLVAAMKAGHQVQAYPFECEWFETGNPNDFLEASEHCIGILKGSESSSKKALTRVLSKYNVDPEVKNISSADVLLGRNAQVSPDAKLSGFICVGEDSEVAAGSVLCNVIIGKKTKVPSGTHVENSLLL